MKLPSQDPACPGVPLHSMEKDSLLQGAVQPACSVNRPLGDICGDGCGGSLGQTVEPQLYPNAWRDKSGSESWKIQERNLS